MFKKAALILAMIVAGFLGAVVVSSPAQAAPLNCPAAHVCFWDNANYPGMPQIWYAPAQTGTGCFNVPSYMNDRISSWVSQTAVYKTILYYNANCGGTPDVDHGGPWATHSVDIWWWCNDCTSSIRFQVA